MSSITLRIQAQYNKHSQGHRNLTIRRNQCNIFYEGPGFECQSKLLSFEKLDKKKKKLNISWIFSLLFFNKYPVLDILNPIVPSIPSKDYVHMSFILFICQKHGIISENWLKYDAGIFHFKIPRTPTFRKFINVFFMNKLLTNTNIEITSSIF